MRGPARAALLAALVAGFVSFGCDDDDATSVIPDDDFEPNDSIQQFLQGDNNARAVLTTTPGPGAWLYDTYGETPKVSVLDPVDYFEITPPTSGVLVVTCAFMVSAGDIDITLWTAAATYVPGGVATNDVPPGKILTVTGVSAGVPYYVRVELQPPAEGNTYDLMWEMQ